MKKAILIPANPARVFMGGQPEGSISAHKGIIRKEGAVIWRLVPPGGIDAGEFPHKDIKSGYIYDVSKKRITHSCNIRSIRPMLNVAYDEAASLVVGGFEDEDHFDSQAPYFYAVRMIAISPLLKERALHSFRKTNDGRPVKLVRNYCIVQDPD